MRIPVRGGARGLAVLCALSLSQLSCVVGVGGRATGGTGDAPPASPPAAAAPGPRPAQIIDRSIELSIRSQYAHNDRVFSPSVELSYLGDSKDDDRILLQYSQSGQPIGRALDCAVDPIRPSVIRPALRHGGTVRCDATPELVSLPGPGTYDLDLTYRMTAEGKDVPWRRITFEVNEYRREIGNRDLMINRDRDIVQGWLTPSFVEKYSYDDCSGIPTLDLSLLISPARTDNQSAPGLVVGRCYVGGKQVGGDQTNAAVSGGFSTTDVNTGEVFSYLPVKILTTFFIAPPEQLHCLSRFAPSVKAGNFIATNPGRWECKVTIDGKLARIVRFDVDAKGQIPLHPEQVGPDALVSLHPGARFVDVELVGAFDRPAARQRLGSSGFFGRPWKSAKLRASGGAAPSQ